MVVIITSLLNVRSYSSSHHTCHPTSSSVNFFFVIITLVAVCCYTTLVVLWDCYGLVCRFTRLCAVMKLRIKKILTDFCDTRTHFAALARACFHESHVWISHSCEYAAHVSKNASHIATLALDVPFPCRLLFLDRTPGKFCLTRSRHNAPCGFSAPRFLAAHPGFIFCSLFLGLVEVIFRHFFVLWHFCSSSIPSSSRC
jgi:hypothetical protein